MTILKNSNQSDIEVVQVTPDKYKLTVKNELHGEYSLEHLAVIAMRLKKDVKVPSKWINELAYVALTHVMNKLENKNV